MIDYEKIYNSPTSTKKVDASWERYMVPSGEDKTRERYEWSVSHLHGSVLDIGAGDGFGAYLMLQRPDIYSITCLEVQKKAIEQMKKHLNGSGVEIIQGAIEYVSLGKGFDSVHCGHTLEHVEHFGLAMEGIMRHAMNRIVISVPLNGGINGMHLREFTSKDQVIELMKGYFHVIGFKEFRKDNRVSSLVVIGNKRTI